MNSKFIKTETVAGLPVLQEQYTFNGSPSVRNLLDGQKLSDENVSVMHLTTYDNKNVESKNDWVTVVRFVAPESKGKQQDHFLNYYPCTKGFKLSKRRSIAHGDARGYKTRDIERWYNKAEKQMKALICEHRTLGARSNTTKNPKYYTAPLRYSIGSKPFMSFAVGLIIESESGDILKELILVGDIKFEHSPTREGSYLKHSKDKNVPTTRKSNINGYSYTRALLYVSNHDDIEDEWESDFSDAKDSMSNHSANDDYLNDDELDNLLEQV